MTLREQAKAITGGVTAGLTALVTALADGQVTGLEWVTVALAAVAAYGVVYRVGQPTSLASLPHISSEELLELARKAEQRETR